MAEKVFNNGVVDLSEKFESKNSIAAIDWGISCAYRYRKVLFIFSLVPALVEASVAYNSYHRSLNPQQVFLAFALAALTTSWLITAASMLSFEIAREKPVDIKLLAFSALKNLPKTLLSYLGLLGILLISFYLQPLLLILVFMIWAPVFCIGEVYTFVAKPARDPEEEGFFDDEEDNFFTKKTVVQDDEAFLFANKSAFELGFARSLQLGFRNILTTLQAGLILWCANVVPAALVGFFLPTTLGFFPEAIKIFLATYCEALSITIIAGAFLLLLSEKSQSELGISNTNTTWHNLNTKPVVSMHKNIVASLLLAGLALTSTAVFFSQLKNTRTVPVELKVEMTKSGMRDNKVYISLRMTDEKSLFRWLEPENFRVNLNNDTNEDNLLIPTATRVVSESSPNDEESRLYSSGPLLVNLEFELKNTPTEPVIFDLLYYSLFSKPQLIISGAKK